MVSEKQHQNKIDQKYREIVRDTETKRGSVNVYKAPRRYWYD